MSKLRTGVLIPALALFLLPAACRKQVTISTPKINAEAAGYIAQGDARLRDSHLYGWRQAEALYQKAYAIAPLDEIRKKLLLARFLVFIRQADEDIPYSGGGEVLKELCAGDQYEKNLCGIAEWIRNGRKAGQLKLSSPMFRGEDPALESYLTLLLFKAVPKTDAFPHLEIDASAPRESPLFLYLNPDKVTSIDPAEFEKNYPQFAEGFQYRAEIFSQRKKYRSAFAYYQKAIDLIPDYANALVGLGNLCFYGLEDYDRALHYYQTALDRDPLSPAAMFGKGMALQQLGSYQESNAVLDRLLAGNLARNKWIDGVPDAQYYSGEARYIKAYNYYLLKDTDKARELVDSAKPFLPYSAEISYLSGLLYYESKNLESARQDFLAAEKGNYANCDAKLYLGLIKTTKGSQAARLVESKGAGFLTQGGSYEAGGVDYLIGAGMCLDSAVGSLGHHISTLNSMDLDPQEQLLMKGRLEKKLLDLRLSSCSTIEMIIDQISNAEIGAKEVYLKHLNEILSRLRKQ